MRKYTTNSLEIKTYEKAYILPREGGVFDSDGVFVKRTSKRRFGTSEWAVNSMLTDSMCSEVEYKDETVLFIGFIRMHYGHFLVDCCGRMWALEEFIKNNATYKIVYISYEDKIADFALKFFEEIGVEKNRLEYVNRSVQYRKVLVPELSFLPMISMNSNYWVKGFDIVISSCKEKCSVNELPKLIYLSQSQYKVGRRYGENVIEKLFKYNGYEILYPERIPLEKQVVLYNSADVLVCTNGTLAHNGIWMRENQKLVILDRFCEEIENPHQGYINDVRNLHVTEINACWKGSAHDLCCMKITNELKNWCLGEGMIVRTTWENKYVLDVLKFFFISTCLKVKNRLLRGNI